MHIVQDNPIKIINILSSYNSIGSSKTQRAGNWISALYQV